MQANLTIDQASRTDLVFPTRAGLEAAGTPAPPFDPGIPAKLWQLPGASDPVSLTFMNPSTGQLIAKSLSAAECMRVNLPGHEPYMAWEDYLAAMPAIDAVQHDPNHPELFGLPESALVDAADSYLFMTLAKAQALCAELGVANPTEETALRAHPLTYGLHETRRLYSCMIGLRSWLLGDLLRNRSSVAGVGAPVTATVDAAAGLVTYSAGAADAPPANIYPTPITEPPGYVVGQFFPSIGATAMVWGLVADQASNNSAPASNGYTADDRARDNAMAADLKALRAREGA